MDPVEMRCYVLSECTQYVVQVERGLPGMVRSQGMIEQAGMACTFLTLSVFYHSIYKTIFLLSTKCALKEVKLKRLCYVSLSDKQCYLTVSWVGLE